MKYVCFENLNSNSFFYSRDSWIQGHPEYDFKFKALIAHAGVFDARNMGFITEEVFFVSLNRCSHGIYLTLSPFLCQ
jgi:hypothetical protein